MKLFSPNFWSNKNFLSLIIFPFSIITYSLNFFKKLYPKNQLNIKTICIGNIYIGGTGKTSLALEINKILKKKNKTVFIKKSYKNHYDEIKLLTQKGKVISNKSRIKSLKIAEKKKFEIALLDDGLQQKNIKYDLKIVCFNSENGIGNGFLLPAGPLRESINELKNYDIVFLNGEIKNTNLYKKIKTINKNLKIFEAIYEPKNLINLDRNKNYLMFCGIGNPNEFENTLKKYKFKVKKKYIFPDHYSISSSEITNIKKIAKKENLNIITTEKDYLRLKNNYKKNIKFLKIQLKIKKPNELKKILNLI
tara:strand:+ start:12 stop:932 length:921 start_codon:yes stop_codon:yes gene_type:complete